VLERVDDRAGTIGGSGAADVEPTPIFHALCAIDPLERFWRDPLVAPLPAVVQPTRSTNRMMLHAVPNVPNAYTESGSSGPAHAAPVGRPAEPAPHHRRGGSHGALATARGGRHRTLRAVTPTTRRRSGNDS
jgi:hypothetical protein